VWALVLVVVVVVAWVGGWAVDRMSGPVLILILISISILDEEEEEEEEEENFRGTYRSYWDGFSHGLGFCLCWSVVDTV